MSDRWLSSALFAVVLTLTAFLFTRLYLLVVRRELQVRGVVYSRTDTPFYYWSLLALVVLLTSVGLAMIAAVGVGMAFSSGTQE